MDITSSCVPYTFSYAPAAEAPAVHYYSRAPPARNTYQLPAAAPTPRKVVVKPAPAPNPMVAFAKSGGHLLYQGVDLFLGLSSMANDWTTLMGNGSWWDKTLAAGDLAFNLGMDVSMIFGIGEELRGGDLAIKGGADLAEHLAADGAEHGGEDLAEHAGEACGGLSFAFATKVATAPGSQSIGSLKPGEKVWAYNTKTQKMELEPVLHVWINHDDDLVDLTISTPAMPKKGTTSEVIHTNKKHPFLTEEQGFVPVSDLHVGMHVREANGSYGQITGWYVVPGTMTMYNLEVQQDHTFTVGEGQWVVHNSGGCINSSQPYNRDLLGKTPSSASTDEVLKRDPNCAYCGNSSQVADHEPSLKQRWTNGEYDNMTPHQARADADNPARMVGSCSSCNSSKSGNPLAGEMDGWNSESSPSNMRRISGL